MLRLVVVALALAFTATAAFAAAKWNSAGWYQLWETNNGVGIIAGPFEDYETCNATLQSSDEVYFYDCAPLSSQPSWDE